MPETSYSKLVDGYRRAFIDSSVEAEPAFTPQFISNYGGNKVLTQLENELRECSSMFMSVAFITGGGIAHLKGVLKEMEAKNVPGRILTTDYLLFSEPAALDALAGLNNLEVRMFRTSGVGFHTKGYLFHNGNDIRIIVGSSNLTQNAITRNFEWNTRVVSTSDGQYAKDIEAEFNCVWESSVDYNSCRDEYARQYQEAKSQKAALTKIVTSLDLSYSKVISPNTMQKGFMTEIERLIGAGESRALLVSATGTGKTYASAFAVRGVFANELIHKKKVLFLSHREMINSQAEKSFRRVLGDSFATAQLSGNCQDLSKIKSANILFATMNMMAKDGFRNQNFKPDDFSIIILDECHRSGAESYQKIIEYFKPDFLLGMSASPDRTDGFDVYELFDHNIACDIRLQTALENDLLCPFHYFGIQDLKVNGALVDVDDFKDLTSTERVKNIIDVAEYYGYSGERVKGLVFCSTVEEAQRLSEIFNGIEKRGAGRNYRTLALSGKDNAAARQSAVERLAADSESTDEILDYIFTVDIFNEGVDIPEINQVIMLRPTQSAIIFVQQLGRGLRKASDKEYVVVLDFIANYNKNYLIPIALSGDRTGNKDNIRRYLIEGNNVINGASTIYFDAVTRKRIFQSIDSARINTRQNIIEGYQTLKRKLGRRPKLADFDKYDEMDPLRILSYMDSVSDYKKRQVCSYHGFKVALDGLEETLTDWQNHILELISQKFASGKRLNEILMLEVLMHASEMDNVIDLWNKAMIGNDLRCGANAVENMLSLMIGEYYDCGSAGKRFKDCILLEEVDGRWHVSKSFSSALSNSDFKSELEDLIKFARGRYERYYKSTDLFRIGQKYTYEDVFRLLDWRKNEVSLNVGGYKFDERTKTYPVFVNYDKSEEISDTTKYEDYFLDQSTLVAISKSKRTLTSKDVQTAVNSDSLGVNMFLFVRKNKDDKESKEFYYLGRIRHNADGILKEFVMPNTDATAVEIEYKLDTPVDKNLFDYITSANV